MSTVEMTSQETWLLRWTWKIRQDLDTGRLLVVGRGGYEDKGQLLGEVDHRFSSLVGVAEKEEE